MREGVEEGGGPSGRTLRLIEGGAPESGKIRAARAGRRAGRPAAPPCPAGIAEELAGPIREAERRIGQLLAGDYGPLRDLQKEELLAASEATELLSAVLSLVGLTEREDAGSPGPEDAFDVRFAAWDTIEEHACRARLKRVRLEISLPPRPLSVCGNRCALRAVLRFALREQLHAVSRGGRLLVEGTEVRGRAVLRIVRRDAGRSTAERSVRLAALSLARSLLGGHGGDIQADSGGLEWRISLPTGRCREAGSTL